ncbi:glycosyltransferase involved in cell wall biosynthesis [Algoriphagus zhangzhouensis]|uniref:Glycosyltransferase involved in cell wall bisynthesis n=2 Tax=Algoriphagus zhangzhouensis TaxID=1073327 RepID=A0A1M7ZAU0_9BACT|nr:glycosyltransferase involved in cell wall biosynthesis [Algoriphagus zhangzhouensis]SHO62028.1 Glycosyltransferase involved in cell wall bisynthesis [Algoriphagus zhangzhouensis]
MAQVEQAMKVYYIHQYFKTPEEGGAVRSFHLAKGLVKNGIKVEIITAGNQQGYDQKWIEGFKVHYLPVSYQQEFGFLKRIQAFYSFVKQAKKLIQKLPRPDLLYISSTPLTTGWIGLWAKKKFALPYIFEVRDLWPEAPIQVGAIRQKFLKTYLYGLEKRIYQQALSIVALSPGIASYIRTKVSNLKISIIPNFSDLEQFYPQNKNEKLREELSLKKGLTIAYAGALGKVNAVDELIDLANMAQQQKKNWQFLIMGEGSKKGLLEEKSNRLGLKNLVFVPFGPKEEVNQILGLADFAWISFAHLPVLKTNSPNKFFDALAAGKAIIVNHKGWVHQLVKKNDLGISCLPGKMGNCFSKLEKLESNPEKLARFQQNSRQLAERYFTKEIAVEKLASIIDPSKTPPTQGDEVYILTA